jgi:bifunctional non-homologous end joining protein LigD
VIDGELVAIDNDGRPDFNLLQNYRSSEAHLVYFAFDILWNQGHSLLNLPLTERRRILRDAVKPNDRLQRVEVATNAEDIVRFVRRTSLRALSPSAPTALICLETRLAHG